MYIFTERYEPKAYKIIPEYTEEFERLKRFSGQDPIFIEHQYGCVACLQFECNGYLIPLDELHAEMANKVLATCNPAPAEKIRITTGFDVDYVEGEGLMRLKDGTYIATENCD